MTDRPVRNAAALMVLALAALGYASQELAHPAAASAFTDKKAAGAELFTTRGCAHCHGDDGQGTDRAPGLRDLRKKLKEGRIRDQIVHGGQGMPAFGESLQPAEVDGLVAFLRAKTWVTPPKPAETAKPAPGF